MITLQFVSGTGLGSSLIKWFGGGPQYSHVDIVWPDGRLFGARNDKIGDVPAGVRFRPASYVADEKTLQIRIPSDSHTTKAFYDFLKAQEGKPYDKAGILAFISNRNWRDPNSWFCSELASAALETSGLMKQLAAPANKITPPDLILVLSALVSVQLPQRV